MNKFNRKIVDSMLGRQDERERLEAARQAAADAYDGAMRRWKRGDA